MSAGGVKAIQGFTELVQQERRNILEGKEPTLIALGRREDDPSQAPSLFRDNSAMNYFANGPMGAPPSWKNEVTLYSLSYALEYDVRQYAKRISPIPLLLMVAAADHTMPAVLGFEFYNDALEPKKLVVLPGGHYDACMPDGSLDLVIQSSAEWFSFHL